MGAERLTLEAEGLVVQVVQMGMGPMPGAAEGKKPVVPRAEEAAAVGLMGNRSN